MGWFEDEFVYMYRLQPLVYGRYIDDIFMIWQHSKEELLEFIEHINSRVPTIKFSQEISDSEINFLDVKVIKNNNTLKTTLYTKPTDSHDYILYSSAHPQRCKDSIPYSQFLRLRRICSDIEDFDFNVLFLSRFFAKKSYPLELLEEAALLARRKDRNSLLLPKPPQREDDSNNKLFFVTRYNPNDSTVKDIVFKNWQILGTSMTTKFIHEKQLMVGYRRPKNIRYLVVRAQIPPRPEDHSIEGRPTPNVEPTTSTPNLVETQGKSKQTTLDKFLVPNNRPTALTTTFTQPTPSYPSTSKKERGFKFCNQPLCKICKLINKTGQIKSHVTQTSHETMKNVSCRSSNLIYCISCKICGKQYVGQTLRRIRDRLSEHLRDIDKADKTKPLGLHFTNHVEKTLEVHIVEFIKKAPRSPQALQIRNRVETRWIHLLRTPIPWGLNLED